MSKKINLKKILIIPMLMIIGIIFSFNEIKATSINDIDNLVDIRDIFLEYSKDSEKKSIYERYWDDDIKKNNPKDYVLKIDLGDFSEIYLLGGSFYDIDSLTQTNSSVDISLNDSRFNLYYSIDGTNFQLYQENIFNFSIDFFYDKNGDSNVQIGSLEYNVGDNYTVQYLSFALSLNTDNLSPVVDGQTFVMNIDDPKDINYYLNQITAIDETDGTVPVKLIEENFTTNKTKIGKYSFKVSATDSSGNTSFATCYVQIVDITSPVINGTTTVTEIGYKEIFNIENFKKTLTVFDNYDSLTYQNITVSEDNYSNNKTKLGSYQVKFKVSDSSSNFGYFTKTIKVIDNVSPIWSGDKTIATNNSTILTESDIRKNITVYDEIDGDLTSSIYLIEDNYSGNGNKVGSYTIIYGIKDKSGNVSNYTITINRNDKIPPKLYVKNGVSFVTSTDEFLTHDQIISILQEVGTLKINATTSVTFINDEYSSNSLSVGSYAVSLLAKDITGNEQIANLMITVEESSEENIVEPEPKSFIEKLKDLIKSVASFFVKVWHNFINYWHFYLLGFFAIFGLVIYFKRR